MKQTVLLLACAWMLWRLDGLPPSQGYHPVDTFPDAIACGADLTSRLTHFQAIAARQPQMLHVFADQHVEVYLDNVPQRTLHFSFACLCGDGTPPTPLRSLPSYPLGVQ